MGAKSVERFFSLADSNFIDDVSDDIKCFIAKKDFDRVLIFPPVSNYRRFLIHKCVEDLLEPRLSTFSIGVGDERRTVICYPERVLSDIACAKPTMGLSQADREDNAFIHTGTGECKRQPRQARPQEKIRSASSKPRRPDRAVYVPRALRSTDTDEKPLDTRKRPPTTHTDKPSKAPRDKSLPGTPRKSLDKNFCNVYTPPHLRTQQSQDVPSVPSDFAIDFSDNNSNDINNFYIGDYFANGQLGLYNPNFYFSDLDNRFSDTLDNSVENVTNEVNMAVPESNTNFIDNGYALSFNKDEDDEANELMRASQEINRSSKRIIKQSFNSDVLVISDAIEEPQQDEPIVETEVEETEVHEPDTSPVKQKLEAKVSLKREENDWDAVFDDSGECLDPSLLEELTSTVGKVHISKAKNNYDQYQTRGQALFNGPFDETFGHVVEVYDFPSEFKTNDLLSVFSEFKDTGFEIKWVDDTHALIVFSSAKIAAEVLATQRPLVRCRPLHAATAESRNKAKKSAEFLQPYRQRPETCTALARRLVSGALGVRLSTARQERAEERRLISLAKEKKRQAALHKEAAWDGSLGTEALSDT